MRVPEVIVAAPEGPVRAEQVRLEGKLTDSLYSSVQLFVVEGRDRAI